MIRQWRLLTTSLQSLSPKWIERFEKLREVFSQDESYAHYRLLPMEPPCIPFIGVALKDLVYACEANSDYTDTETINFPKLRLIQNILNSLMLEKPELVDYSDLPKNLGIIQQILLVRGFNLTNNLH